MSDYSEDEFNAQNVALGGLKPAKRSNDTPKPKKKRRGPSPAQQKLLLKAMESRLKYALREIEILRRHMSLDSEIKANIELWKLKGHP